MSSSKLCGAVDALGPEKPCNLPEGHEWHRHINPDGSFESWPHDRIDRVDVVHRLAALIDSDEPPGLAAHRLARTVVALVEDRGATEAALLDCDLEALVNRYRRKAIELRYCTVCNFYCPNQPPVEARFVAADARGREWYECGLHSPTNNIGEVLRVKFTPIDVWLANGNTDLNSGAAK